MAIQAQQKNCICCTAAPPLKSLPPTSEAFREHVKRAHLIAAQILHPPNLSLVEQGWTYDDLSKCFDPVTHPSGVEPPPAEVPQLIPCGCSQPNHVKVQYVVHYVQLIELVCQYIRNNKHILPLRHTLVIPAQSHIPVELFHGNEIKIKRYLQYS